MLLLLTNSIDGTADVLAQLCRERSQGVFRFNIDAWSQYRFAWTSSGFAFADPLDRMLRSEDVQCCLWRRPSLEDTPQWEGALPEDRLASQAELHAWVREIAEWARARRMLRLIEPAASRRVGKLAQMRVAADLFTVPEWAFGWGVRWPGEATMVKRLVSTPVGPGHDRYIFVQEVNAQELSPAHPWFLQRPGVGARDATIVFVNGRCFGFQMRRTRSEYAVQDWRTLDCSDRSQWTGWELSSGMCTRVCSFMQRVGLRFGRLDFLTSGQDMIFLEVNPTGQFGWLDEPDAWPLHRAVLDEVQDPGSAVLGAEVVVEDDGGHDPGVGGKAEGTT